MSYTITILALKKTYKYVGLILMGLCIGGCVESFEPKTEVFEDALVIESTITSEVKQQEILLNRAFRFEEFVPVPEENADVVVIDDLQNTYLFQEAAPGRYVSISSFGAEQNRSYQLLVTTSEGREYASDLVFTPETSPIQGLKVERTDADGDGMSIFVEYGASHTSRHFRYKFEETYKIVAPEWNSQMLDYEGPVLVVKTRIRDEKECYKTEFSDKIILNVPQMSTQNNILDFAVRFIDRDNYIISHRYSLLVKQFAISEESYDYLEKLAESSDDTDIFSQAQPGFFRGNVYATDNRDEKVLGFFHVASVSEQRIFFNYQDYFPSEPLPPYVENCLPFVARTETPREIPTIHDLIAADAIRYHSLGPQDGAFFVVPRICGDCTVLGDTEVPDFWVE